MSAVEDIAAEAVSILGVGRAIREEADSLMPRIEECDTFAEGAPVDSNMMFLALSLPIANGLIHFATSRERLQKAREWVRRNWRDESHEPDPISTLAALTLIYIVNEGWRQFGGDEGKKVVWSRIKQRVEKLKQDVEAAPPVA